MTEFLDLLEVELRGAADRRWAPRRAPRRSMRALAVAATLLVVLAIGAVVLLTGSGEHHASVPAGGEPTTYRDRAHHFSVTYPAGWHRAAQRLTPALADPREILTVGSGKLPPQHVASDCAQLPSRALKALGAGQALVTVQELARPVPSFPPRPARWEWGSTRSDARLECAPPGVDLRWLSFRQAGRAFYALVAIGPGSSAADGRRAMAVLSSFRPRPR